MNTALKNTILVAASAIAGVATGYLVGSKITTDKAIREFEKLEVIYQDALDRRFKEGKYATVESAAEAVLQTPVSEIHVAEEPKELPDFPDVETVNEHEVDVKALIEKFNNHIPGEYGGVTFPGQVESINEDMDQMDIPIPTVPDFVSVRDPHGPYIISIDEYMEDDTPFTKVEMTYFEGDGTLVDVNDKPIPDIDNMIGAKNLGHWGEGTTDKEQFYVRNERLEIDIEVTRDEQTYTRSILGIIPEDEIARSMTKPLKLREGDGY